MSEGNTYVAPTPTTAPVGNHVDPAKIKSVLDIMLKAAKFATKLIPGDTDDKVVATFEKLVAEDWFVELVGLIVDQVDGKSGDELKGVILDSVLKHTNKPE
jgi:hypothetical protein